jgi:hypothetical protein
MATESSSPILKDPTKNTSKMTNATTATAASPAVTTLSILRTLVGVSCIVSPPFVGKLFFFPLASSQSSLLLRLFGFREAVLGDLTWTARNGVANASERQELRHLLYGNVAADAMDCAGIAWALYNGHVGRRAAGMFIGGAVAFIAMGIAGLRGVKHQEQTDGV